MAKKEKPRKLSTPPSKDNLISKDIIETIEVFIADEKPRKQFDNYLQELIQNIFEGS